jgi:hypothetical protein
MTTMSRSNWTQPAPTKRFAVYFEGYWYGQGDTHEAAWGDVKRQLSPQYDRYGAALYAKIRRFGNTKAVEG